MVVTWIQPRGGSEMSYYIETYLPGRANKIKPYIGQGLKLCTLVGSNYSYKGDPLTLEIQSKKTLNKMPRSKTLIDINDNT